MATNKNINFDPSEIEKFERLSSQWWDPSGDFEPLHKINPLRLDYICQHTELENKKIIDLGCGGGILSESIDQKGGNVTGIDIGERALSVARLHQKESRTNVEYLQTTAEDIAEERPNEYDVLTCLEMLEHVPSPSKVIRAGKKLVKPGGSLFFSTINRNPKSFLFAIIGAEYILRILPKGTHNYEMFIKPSELEHWCRSENLNLISSIGIHYNPLINMYNLNKNIDVNYIMYFNNSSE